MVAIRRVAQQPDAGGHRARDVGHPSRFPAMGPLLPAKSEPSSGPSGSRGRNGPAGHGDPGVDPSRRGGRRHCSRDWAGLGGAGVAGRRERGLREARAGAASGTCRGVRRRPWARAGNASGVTSTCISPEWLGRCNLSLSLSPCWDLPGEVLAAPSSPCEAVILLSVSVPVPGRVHPSSLHSGFQCHADDRVFSGLLLAAMFRRGGKSTSMVAAGRRRLQTNFPGAGCRIQQGRAGN